VTRSSRRTPAPAHWLILGPGHGRDDDLARLAAGYETGWCDHHGDPAPWPEDFLAPGSGWHPQEQEIPTSSHFNANSF
jgi:hypothetical protein